MAIDLTDGQGTSGHPARARKVYIVEKTLDFAEALVQKGSALAATDVYEVLDVPAETFVLAAGAEVITVGDATAATVNVDFAGGDDYVDGADIIAATGYCAAGTNGWAGLQTGSTSTTAVNRITATDTLDVTLATLTGTLSTGKLRVYAILMDISGVNEVSPLV